MDGSAHILGDRGLIFLFNSGDSSLSGEFALTEESIGLKGQGDFEITQEHPQSARSVKAAFSETVGDTSQTRGGAQHPSYDIDLSGSGDVVMTDQVDG